ncbi:MAG: ATP phosphoribosyltransferase, partial [Gammaproteobacteria bacterium]|nr:ATP phosphoribosyltransferase [Gammaproteobacteria bacterium]
PLEHVADISSRLVVNKASWKMKHNTVMQLLETMREAVNQQNS